MMRSWNSNSLVGFENALKSNKSLRKFSIQSKNFNKQLSPKSTATGNKIQKTSRANVVPTLNSFTSLNAKPELFELSPTFLNANNLQIQTRGFAALPGRSDSSFRKWVTPTVVVLGTGFVLWNWGWPLFKVACLIGGAVFGLNWLKNQWLKRRAIYFYDNILSTLNRYKPIIEKELAMSSFQFPSLGACKYYVRIEKAKIGTSPFIYIEIPVAGTNGTGKVTAVGQVMDFRLVKDPTPTNRFLLRRITLSYWTNENGKLTIKEIELDHFDEDITIIDADTK